MRKILFTLYHFITQVLDSIHYLKMITQYIKITAKKGIHTKLANLAALSHGIL